MKRLLGGFLFILLLLAFAGEARATTIAPNCGTCGSHNTAWDLTLALINNSENIYQLTVTATYGSPRDFIWVNAIAFKVDAFTNSYEGNPGVSVTGPTEAFGWTIAPGGISADGCSGHGNGFFCADSTLFGATPLVRWQHRHLDVLAERRQQPAEFHLGHRVVQGPLHGSSSAKRSIRCCRRASRSARQTPRHR